MSAATPFRSEILAPADFTAEWDAAMNKLRIADATTDRTIVVYSNGEVYRVAPEAPAGHVVITVTDGMPHIVAALVHAGVIRVVRSVHDPVFEQIVVTALVLL